MVVLSRLGAHVEAIDSAILRLMARHGPELLGGAERLVVDAATGMVVAEVAPAPAAVAPAPAPVAAVPAETGPWLVCVLHHQQHLFTIGLLVEIRTKETRF